MEISHAAEPVRRDRISMLDDAVLGQVLSFLPSKQAARAAALSSRWRDAFATVHTLSLEEPSPVTTYDSNGWPTEVDPPEPFRAAITAAIVARHRKPGAAPPLRALRALRVALQDYSYLDSIAVDLWVSYALKRAGPDLELDLCFRSLLSPPSAVSLPSLQELLLTRISDTDELVQRLISGCPRLGDLTLESCDAVTMLSLLDTRLRRLALRCCHNLSHVVVDVSELGTFEYRGAVPEMPLLTTLGATCWFPTMPSLASCTVYICGGEVTAPEELASLTAFLQHFASAKHLRLRSKCMYPDIGKGAVTRLPAFWHLHHLELWGHLLHDGDAAATVSVTSRILRHAPNLEVLSLFFETGTGANIDDDGPLPTGRDNCKAMELLNAHRLKYNRYNILDWPSGGAMIPCLANRLREINLVHYQGGRAQRTLAKFLLCNAPVIGELWCQFAEGPFWMQTELMREMKSWVMNERANTVFR
ncbi:FBD-associated F-box protein At5g60610-like [Lolium perenne]|uniref:FBD-associated F-box protein At5g60610-like n=1 Tax=Lolium perenne TaxID=4522 RepID=UPI003A9A62D9